MNLRLSIVIPTIGRRSLGDLLREIAPQTIPEDEILVVGDGLQVAAAEICRGFQRGVTYFEYGPDHAWGHPQRNEAIKFAKGTHLFSIDDDDALRPGALDEIRKVVMEYPDRPLIFRMKHKGGLLWKEPILRPSNVSTQMFVVPNLKERVGTWGYAYAGDFDFIRSTVDLYPHRDKEIVWRKEVIAVHGIKGVAPKR